MKKLIYAVALLIVASACNSKKEIPAYSWEDDLHQRLLNDFCLTRSQVKQYIQKYIPDVSDEQMDSWEESRALECMVLDGEKRYFRNAGPNLFRLDSACVDIKLKKDGASSGGSEDVNYNHLPEVISAAKEGGEVLVAPKRMRITYTLTVDTNAVPAGKMIRCWLPYPRSDVKRQTEVKFLGASQPDYLFSPADCCHSTLYMEKRAEEGRPTVFSESFEYTSRAEWHNLKPEDIQHKVIRFRTLGCYPLTGGVESTADTLDAIVQETLGAVESERTSRVIDHDGGAGSMEKRKREGYF